MKKLSIFLFLAIIAAFCAGSQPVQAKTISAASQAHVSRKADKKLEKARKKYQKAERKAQRKMIKKDRKNTHYPTLR